MQIHRSEERLNTVSIMTSIHATSIVLSSSDLQITQTSITPPSLIGRSEEQNEARKFGKVGETDSIGEFPSQEGGTEAVLNDRIEHSQAAQTVCLRPKKKVC